MGSRVVRTLAGAALALLSACGDGSESNSTTTIRYTLVPAENVTSFDTDKGSRLISTSRFTDDISWASLSGSFDVEPVEAPSNARFAFRVVDLQFTTPEMTGDVRIEGSSGAIIGYESSDMPLEGEVTVRYLGSEVRLTVEAFLPQGVATAYSDSMPPEFTGLSMVGSLGETSTLRLFIFARPKI